MPQITVTVGRPRTEKNVHGARELWVFRDQDQEEAHREQPASESGWMVYQGSTWTSSPMDQDTISVLGRSKNIPWFQDNFQTHEFGPRKMIDRAFQWADKNGKSRTNAVHGDPEAFLVISDTFCISATDVEENEQAGSIECEDWGSQKAFIFPEVNITIPPC